tara:strand:+ start:279 stop:428 length:150 start_codon:yes stop_codon:yes gene_type:complete
MEMKPYEKHFSKSRYARIREWKLFRKRVVPSKKRYDRRKLKLDIRKEDK